MKIRFTLVLGIISLMAATLSAQKVNVDWERGTNFAQFHTYAWQPSPDPAKGLWDQRVIDGVNQQLQAKGFQLVTSNPQLWVVYTSHVKHEQQVVGTGYNMGPTWGWGYWGGPSTTTYNTYTYKEGTLVVEIADNNGRTLLWRGTATDTLPGNPEKGIKMLNNAMNKLFKNFPPKPGSK